MKRLITATLTALSLTTAPAYGQTATRLAIELGEYQGVAYCTALNHGIRSKEQMAQVFVEINHPALTQAIEQYTAWKDSGNQALVEVMFDSTFDYAMENCPVLFRRYMEENN